MTKLKEIMKMFLIYAALITISATVFVGLFHTLNPGNQPELSELELTVLSPEGEVILVLKGDDAIKRGMEIYKGREFSEVDINISVQNDEATLKGVARLQD